MKMNNNNEIKHIITFDDKTLSILSDLVKEIKENNTLLKSGNPNEFAREVCANIYADMLIENLFPEGYNRLL